MELVRDVLDTLVVDRNGREMGRVDGIVAEQRDGAPPRVSGIAIGPAVLGSRLHPIVGRWVAALEHGFGVDAGRPVVIPFSRVIRIGSEVKLDVAIGETAVGTVERRVAAWIGKIPGAR